MKSSKVTLHLVILQEIGSDETVDVGDILLLRPPETRSVSTRATTAAVFPQAVTITCMEMLRENGQNGHKDHPEISP